MKIKLGMPSLIELNSIEDNIMICKELGLEFVEINMNMNYCLPYLNNIDNIKNLLKEKNIQLTMHFPEEIDFGTPFDIVREANIKLFEEFCVYAYSLNITKVNIHLLPGAVVTLPNKKMWSYEIAKNVFYNNLIKSLEEVIRIAKKYNIIVCIENTVVPPYLEEAFIILSRINDLKFTYDIGHDAKANYNVESIYKSLGDRVSHMHMHDYDGNTDHQILFKGSIDLIDRLEMAKMHKMSVVIEVKNKEALKLSVEQLRVRKLI